MTVLIAGAGIGGLTLGLSLHQNGIPFQIVETVQNLRPLGVGINLQPHAVREIAEMGLSAEMEACGIRTKEVGYFSEFGTHIWSEPRGIWAGYKWPQYSMHRGRFQMMLYNALIKMAGPECVALGKRATGLSQTADDATLHLTDRASDVETRLEGAVIIAVDGINSTLRNILFPNATGVCWGGTIMWRGTTVAPAFLSGATMAMAGRKDIKFVAYPIEHRPGGKMLINWICDLTLPPDHPWNEQDWNRTGDLSDFLPRFADWHFDWLDVPATIRAADAVYEFPMVDLDPLDRWTYDRVTLLGDAAHAMYPIGSNGASQAILDARVLTRAFLDHGITGTALETYEADRRPKTAAIVHANRGDGPDRILDEVAARAPAGFEDISDIMTLQERENIAKTYKSIAGFEVDELNSRASILPSRSSAWE